MLQTYIYNSLRCHGFVKSLKIYSLCRISWLYFLENVEYYQQACAFFVW